MKKINIFLVLIFILASFGYGEVIKVYHIVKKGETLIAIAKEYGTSVSEIKRLNNLRSNLIIAGEKLVVKRIVRKKKKYKKYSKNNNTSAVWGYETIYHRVRKGDSLWKISKKYGISISSIKKLNRLRSSRIKPGMRLKIKVPRKVPKVDKIKPIIGTEKKIFYQVKKGDTLENVAKKFGITPEEIKKYNLLGEEDFKVGQIIIIPEKKKLSDSEEKETQMENGKFSRAEIINSAFSYLNMPYKLGGNGKRYIDCSTLTRLVYKKVGIELPKTSYYQFKEGKKVSLSEALPGDLVFFKRGRYVGHVGIYIGNNLFIHASNKNGKVTINSLDSPYFKNHFICVKRYIPCFDNVIARRIKNDVKE
ncbi:LysM peptidoglycan-binding domain-containing protein [bacterium]|nr:LysM peptidoglycan-binding domain-containing protein [bacterium]